MFIHLNTHSAYSLQEGIPSPFELAQAAHADGMPALGLTDHDLLTGAVEFIAACRGEGIQPVIGLEIELESCGLLALLTTSLEGWSNLCRLSSTLLLRDDPHLPCPLPLLARYSSDLIGIAYTQKEPAEEGLKLLKDLLAGRLYLSLHDPSTATASFLLTRRLGVKTVVTHPVYTLHPGQYDLQRTLTAIRLNAPRERLPEGATAPPGSHFTSAHEMEKRFEHFPAALAATQEIAERCQFRLPLGVAHMPAVPLPPGLTATQHLRLKAEEGARRLYGTLQGNVQERLDHELEVIAGMGFEPVFLIVEELLDFARQKGIPYSSRGSAASSLVAHCLGITSPDPLRLDLYFERFLNPARTTPPDIDTDLCSRGRERVIQHVFEVYGAERVAMVGTINRFRPRSALGDSAKAHGVEPTEIRRLVEQLPYAYWNRRQEGEEERDQPSPFTDLRRTYPAARYQRFFADAEALLRLPRHLSVHAGGIIVAPEKITDLVPVMHSGSKGVTITQFDLTSIEALGLVKIDLLGIRGLTVLGDVAGSIFDGLPGRYSTPMQVLEATPALDAETAARVEAGQTIGCFQIESPGMRATLREIHARCEDDLMAALALYRPGPLTGGLKDAFVRRFKGEEPVTHIHPALAPLLEETFGVILYQEQVLRIAHELADFSLAEADLLRRAMSHFDPGRRMQELRSKFIREANARSGIPAEKGEHVWEMMAAFAGYGFPKAHAASYAKVGWRSAWCKTHFPAEFMAAVLANWGGYYSQRVYLGEARRLGLTVQPPHVNFAGRNFLVRRLTEEKDQKVLFMGLDQVRDLTSRTIERIISCQPFNSLEDFLSRADPRPLEAANLASVGSLEGFGTIPAILGRLKSGWQAGQPSLFAWEEPAASREEDWTLAQKVAAQQEILGTSLEAHPLELLGGQLSARGAVTTIEAAGRLGQRVTVAGLRQSSHRSRTAKGDSMLFLTIEDLSGMLDVIIFPDVYRQVKSFVHQNIPLLFTGTVEMDTGRGEPTLRVEKVEMLQG